ncbi:MAG: LacI family transcriptional regulator [Oscillospiraceae bacterium]|nr:MAG: LacI family transcriptional regulator [Oscillospiraceae bacterium]
MTLKEIAEKVGVSPSTVSRVINKNDTKCASQAVRERIWDEVSASGYVPNQYAQRLKMASYPQAEAQAEVPERNLACIFARTGDINNDPFFNSIYRAVEKEAFGHGYFLKYSLSFPQIVAPSSLELLKTANIDGIVILGRCKNEHLQLLYSEFRNLIYVGLNDIEPIIDQVVCDGYQVARTAVHYLHSLGHTSIGYIGEIDNEIRYKGYRDEMASLGLTAPKEQVIDIHLSMEGGYHGVRRLREGGGLPGAIFCCNDITAVGAIKGIKEMGLKIPQDVSLLSIDDIEMASYVTPMLSTISIPKEEMGKMAVKILLDRINKGHRLPMKLELPYQIKRRESCRDLTAG